MSLASPTDPTMQDHGERVPVALTAPAGAVSHPNSHNNASRLVLGIPLRDATGGYRAFRRPLLETIGLADVASQGYCFQVDLAWRALRSGYRVVEVPITFVERENGTSKMSRAVVTEALWRVTVWGARYRVGALRRLVTRSGARQGST